MLRGADRKEVEKSPSVVKVPNHWEKAMEILAFPLSWLTLQRW